MLGLFKPRCPVGLASKVWIERRFRDLCHGIGIERVRHLNVLVPGSSDLPPKIRGTSELAQQVFEVVCARLGLSPGEFELEQFPSHDSDQFVTNYVAATTENPRPVIRYSSSLLTDDERLLAGLARPAAHHLLNSQFQWVAAAPDADRCADLLPVLFGLGIFMANATARNDAWTSQSASMSYTSWSRHGHLTSAEFGYALALLAWLQGERKPDWSRHLRLDALDALNKGLSFLRRTEESLFSPDNAAHTVSNRSTDQLADLLASGNATEKYDALIELEESPEMIDAVQSRIAPLLDHRDRELRLQAVVTLSNSGNLSSSSFESLLNGTTDSDDAVRRTVALTLRPGLGSDEAMVTMLLRLTRDGTRFVERAAAVALTRFPELPDEVHPYAESLLKRSFNDADSLEAALALLKRFHPDLPGYLQDRFGEDEDWMHLLGPYIDVEPGEHSS